MIFKKFIFGLTFLLAGCTGLPDGVTPVDHFQLERYLGTWYEIARLDHSFERGLSQVSAEYSLNADGSVKVINRGYSAGNNKWKQAEGKAYFVKRPDQGFLKVSFFGPFYGSYVILELDKNDYAHALVCGPDRSYLWILARSPKISNEVKNALVAKASDLGFKTENLIWVRHDAF
jgi:apolipoprotein D and lipocalin family protein